MIGNARTHAKRAHARTELFLVFTGVVRPTHSVKQIGSRTSFARTPRVARLKGAGRLQSGANAAP